MKKINIKQPSQEVNEKLDNKTERFWKETLQMKVKLTHEKTRYLITTSRRSSTLP
jgi:hypothetical protein